MWCNAHLYSRNSVTSLYFTSGVFRNFVAVSSDPNTMKHDPWHHINNSKFVPEHKVIRISNELILNKNVFKYYCFFNTIAICNVSHSTTLAVWKKTHETLAINTKP